MLAGEMPEGHTIHRLARNHLRELAHEPLAVSSPQGRAAETAALLDGSEIDHIDAYGKHLLYRFSTGDTLHIHLGLYGRFRKKASPAPEPRSPPRLRLAGPEWTYDLSGPTACELFDPVQEDRLLARLGPDPLRRDGDPERFAANLSRRRIPIGAALLDQAVIAGLGNVYRAELLLLARIDPHTPARDMRPAQVQELWDRSVTLLRAGVKANRIVTAPRRPGRKGRIPRSEATNVYRRQSCLQCGESVSVEELGARTLYWCPACQV